jgi:hypothetical protein
MKTLNFNKKNVTIRKINLAGFGGLVTFLFLYLLKPDSMMKMKLMPVADY